ncbi:hypothetical protein [Acholeplasma granularum]|uniref:hypothetical protein n=1 Tax=Acholeplasma granularum TaxID=264635 RepID=UPI000471645B|nr:hypothetical protein [Acholeplasma granularum]
MKKQMFYRVISIIFLVLFIIITAITLNKFHPAYHIVSILGIGIITTSLFIKVDIWVARFDILFTLFLLFGIYMEIELSGRLSNFGIVLILTAVVFAILSILEAIANKLFDMNNNS